MCMSVFVKQLEEDIKAKTSIILWVIVILEWLGSLLILLVVGAKSMPYGNTECTNGEW